MSVVVDPNGTKRTKSRGLPEPPERRVSGEGIAHLISSAGLQISQAADELQQAARGLLEADRAAREAEERWAVADAQVALAARKNAELTDALETAQSGRSEAEEQVRRAEQRLQAAVERRRELERELEQAKAAVEHRDELERELESAKTALEQAKAAVEHRDELERELESAKTALERQRELEQAAEKTAADLSAAEERALRAEQRLQATVEHQREMEQALAEIETKWREAEAQPKVMIVDGERQELHETLGAELRRPLTSILGLTLALKHADPRSAESKTMIKQLTSNARRLDRLVGQMLDLDKIATGTFTPNRRRTDVEALVRRVVEDAPDLANRDLKVETEHVAINVDPALTEQMVETLLANAGRRSAPGSPVWVRVSSGQGGVVIAVDDTGPETPEGLRAGKLSASLTDDRGPAARRKKPRGATGLVLLSRLAELHGGRAWVEERPGGGASFRVFLSNEVQEPIEEDTDARAVDLVSSEEDEVLFDTATAGAGLRELSSFDDLTGDIAV